MKIINKADYEQKVKINDRDVKCYTRNKMKELYPDGNYKIVGETFEKNKKKEIDRINIADRELIISKYGENSRLLYKRKGFLQVGENEFLVILNNRLAFLIILLTAIIIGSGMTAFAMYTFFSIPTVAPDYELPPEDKNATSIRGDNSQKVTSQKGGGAVTVRLENSATVHLDTETVDMIYQNPNSSNQDSVITLCIIKGENEYAIARSELVKVGNQITTLKLLEDRINLVPGIYKGRYIIDHYNPETGEKAITNAKFNDIKVTVK